MQKKLVRNCEPTCGEQVQEGDQLVDPKKHRRCRKENSVPKTLPTKQQFFDASAKPPRCELPFKVLTATALTFIVVFTVISKSA